MQVLFDLKAFSTDFLIFLARDFYLRGPSIITYMI